LKKFTFNWEIRTLIAEFTHAFNDIVIKRYNNLKEPQDQIHVNYIYAPKNRVLHDIVNKAQHIKIPIVSVSITSLQRDETRVFNKIEGPFYNMGLSATGFSHPLQPVPVNISVNMSIITRFQTDMDQILTNFIPYNDPYVVLSWREPYTNHEIRTIVEWAGNISMQYPTDIGSNDQYRILADTSFVIKGWLYKDPDEPVGKIYNIDTTFTAVSNIFANYETMESYESDITTDYFTISGRPFISMCDPYMTIPCTVGKQFTLHGKMFERVVGLYVSGGPDVFSEQLFYDPLSGNIGVSAYYPGFTGINIENWDINNNNEITFTMPSAVSAGYIDIIAVNEAGYGLLTQDSIRAINNPYPIGVPEHNTYVQWQPPVVSGVYVAPFYYNCA
jgi:hypothetical protein